jgi:hypothetical protein
MLLKFTQNGSVTVFANLQQLKKFKSHIVFCNRYWNWNTEDKLATVLIAFSRLY